MPPQDKRRFYIGVDVGSTSSDIVVLDSAGKSVLCDYQRTKGKPIETVRLQLEKVFRQINPSDITLAVATGSAGRFLAKLLDIPFMNEVPAQAAAICHLYPQLQQATIIEMGGQDSKLIFYRTRPGQSARFYP
jgi:activator of 2-hydroxyglutaryl-CoA dehydratase